MTFFQKTHESFFNSIDFEFLGQEQRLMASEKEVLKTFFIPGIAG
jgi:hypothetical protein